MIPEVVTGDPAKDILGMNYAELVPVLINAIKELKGEERVIEIAKMLSGDKVSDASLANARELIAS